MIDDHELTYVEGLTKEKPIMHLVSTQYRSGHVQTSCGAAVRFRNAKDAVIPYMHAVKFAGLCERCK